MIDSSEEQIKRIASFVVAKLIMKNGRVKYTTLDRVLHLKVAMVPEAKHD